MVNIFLKKVPLGILGGERLFSFPQFSIWLDVLWQTTFTCVLKSVCVWAGTSPSGVHGPHMDRGQTLSQAEEERSDEELCHAPPHQLERWEEHQEAPGRRHHQPGRRMVKGHFGTAESFKAAVNHVWIKKRIKKQLLAQIARKMMNEPNKEESGCLDRCLTGDLFSVLYKLLWSPGSPLKQPHPVFANFPAFLSQPLGCPRVAEKSRSGRIISHWSANGPSSTGTRTAASYGDAGGDVFFH